MKFSAFTAGLLLLSAGSLLAASAPLSAFQAKEVAAKVVPAAARNQVIAIDGPRSENNLTPDTWRFVFYDETAKQEGRLVTVKGDRVTEIRDGYFELHSFRLAAYKPEEAMKLKVDSKQALAIVTRDARLKGIPLSSVLFYLHKESSKEESPGVWQLTLIADRKGYEVEIGKARVHVETGAILSMNLQLEKLKEK